MTVRFNVGHAVIGIMFFGLMSLIASFVEVKDSCKSHGDLVCKLNRALPEFEILGLGTGTFALVVFLVCGTLAPIWRLVRRDAVIADTQGIKINRFLRPRIYDWNVVLSANYDHPMWRRNELKISLADGKIIKLSHVEECDAKAFVDWFDEMPITPPAWPATPPAT